MRLRTTFALLFCVGVAASPFTVAPPKPDCAIIVFRHTQKTGGTTLRGWFRELELTGDWELYGPQGDILSTPEFSNASRLRVLLELWVQLKTPFFNFSQTPRRLMIEYHVEADAPPAWETFVDTLNAVRPLAAHRRCPVILFTLLRAPAEAYASLWRYQALGEQKGRQPLEAFVRARPNVQATELAAGLARAGGGLFQKSYYGVRGPNALAGSRLGFTATKMLEQMDFVVPTSSMRSFMYVLCLKAGLFPLGFQNQNEGVGHTWWRDFREALEPKDVARMDGYATTWEPSRDDDLVAAVREHAPLDERFHNRSASKFERIIGALDPPRRAQLAAILREEQQGAGARAAGWLSRPARNFEWRLGAGVLPGAMRSVLREDYVRDVPAGRDALAAFPKIWSLVPVKK